MPLITDEGLKSFHRHAATLKSLPTSFQDGVGDDPEFRCETALNEIIKVECNVIQTSAASSLSSANSGSYKSISPSSHGPLLDQVPKDPWYGPPNDRTNPSHRDFPLYVGEQLGKAAGKPAFKYEIKEFKEKFEEKQRRENPKIENQKQRYSRKISAVVRKLEGQVGVILHEKDNEKLIGKKHRQEWGGKYVVTGSTQATTFKEFTFLAIDIAKIDTSVRDKTLTITLREGSLDGKGGESYRQTNVDRKLADAKVKYTKMSEGEDRVFGGER